MSAETQPLTIHRELIAESVREPLSPTGKAFKDFQNSLAIPTITTLITFLSAATLHGYPETFPFIAAGGGTTTLIFAADSGRRFLKHRRIARNSSIQLRPIDNKNAPQ
jgi:hypothetical protein